MPARLLCSMGLPSIGINSCNSCLSALMRFLIGVFPESALETRSGASWPRPYTTNRMSAAAGDRVAILRPSPLVPQMYLPLSRPSSPSPGPIRVFLSSRKRTGCPPNSSSPASARRLAQHCVGHLRDDPRGFLVGEGAPLVAYPGLILSVEDPPNKPASSSLQIPGAHA